MKKLLLFFAFTITFLNLAANHDKNRIEKLIQPYEQALEFVASLKPNSQIKDFDIFMFFSKNDMHEKKDIRKFDRTMRVVKKLAYTKKSLIDHRYELEILIENLEKVKKFIVDYATTYYALMTCQEITASYYYIDELNEFIVSLIINQSEKLGLPSMRGRGLYKFVKKIDIDLRRLTTLFQRDIMTDEMVVKANQIKTKLVILKSKIVESSEYRSQLSKTRWLKAFGVISTALIVIPTSCLSTSWPAYACIGTYAIARSVVAIHEMREATKYNIPVHSTSMFSWFTPVFLPLTWIPRG